MGRYENEASSHTKDISSRTVSPLVKNFRKKYIWNRLRILDTSITSDDVQLFHLALADSDEPTPKPNLNFPYGRLGEGEFRILRLIKGKIDDQLSVELRRHDVRIGDDDGEKYDTISYPRDTENHDHSILVDGRVFFVSGTLEAALREFRARDYRNVRVDAICINQNDVDERNSQVRLMAEICKQSSRLLLWLGVVEDESDEAMDFLLEESLQIQTKMQKHKSNYGTDTLYIPTVSEDMYLASTALENLLWKNLGVPGICSWRV
jgi:hypothetical protein